MGLGRKEKGGREEAESKEGRKEEKMWLRIPGF